MISWPVYLIVTSICLLMVWLGIGLHARVERERVDIWTVKYLLVSSIVCFFPLAQVAPPIAIWVVFLMERVRSLELNRSMGNALQRIANRLDSIVHYGKVK